MVNVDNLIQECKNNVIISKLIESLGIHTLPSDISISTMTLACKMNTKFNCRKIAKYIDLSYDGILSVKCGNEYDLTTNRSLLPKKKKTGKKK